MYASMSDKIILKVGDVFIFFHAVVMLDIKN